MNKYQFWQNFELGIELQISGSFIYNGLKNLHDLDSFHYEEDVFEILYNLSVGIERLLKVAVILLEYNDDTNDIKFEESLITHNHLNLLNRIKVSEEIKLSDVHNTFLQLLTKFYKSYRYDRFMVQTVNDRSKDKNVFLEFISKYLKIDMIDDGFVNIPRNNKICRFIGRTVGKITEQVYCVIQKAASAKNIYTDEIRTDSKASKIFLEKRYTFENEDVFWKEIIIYLMNNKEDTGLLKLMRGIEPLELDPELLPEYLESFKSDFNRIGNMGEVEELYNDIPNKKERLKTLEIIGKMPVI